MTLVMVSGAYSDKEERSCPSIRIKCTQTSLKVALELVEMALAMTSKSAFLSGTQLRQAKPASRAQRVQSRQVIVTCLIQGSGIAEQQILLNKQSIALR